MPRPKPEALDRETLDLSRSYTVVQVAHLVGWSPKWLRQLIREGRVEAHRPGGHEYRIHGAEINRIMNNLQHQKPVGPKASPVDNAREIPVSEEQMDKVAPNRETESPAQTEPKKSFWDSLDDDVKLGNPLLFGGEGS